jgi:class 3 adenylate cyclase
MAVNMAAKLQEAAREGEIIVSRETLNQLPDEIGIQELPPLCVKGINEPVAVYRIIY